MLVIFVLRCFVCVQRCRFRGVSKASAYKEAGSSREYCFLFDAVDIVFEKDLVWCG